MASRPAQQAVSLPQGQPVRAGIFLGAARNYRMTYFPSAVLSLIISLELVLPARHNMRGQTQAVSSAGLLPPPLALPREHLPVLRPILLPVLGTWGQKERVSEWLGRGGGGPGFAAPGVRQRMSG